MNILMVRSIKIKNLNKYRIGFLVILAIFVLFFISNNQVYAEEGENKLSWTSASPDVFNSSLVSVIPSSICEHSFSLKDIAGEFSKLDLCMSEGGPLSFGFSVSDAQYKTFVNFANDVKMHRFYGGCDRYDSCLYLPSTDTLVTKSYLISGYTRSLVVYKNFSKRLSPFINPSNLSTEYRFDASSPDYIFKNASGYAWPIGGFGASNNGKWLAIEFRQRGIGLLDIETLEMKRISANAFYYGYGFDPTVELAVANDGSAIAVMGTNAGLTIFENSDNCGDKATDERMTDVVPIVSPCKSSPIRYDDFAHRFFYATYPSFTEDGLGLDFYAVSYDGSQLGVSLRAAGYKSTKLEYLALGDSYTSGEGEYSDQYYLEGTNEEFEKCHVSSRSYPFLVAGLSRLNLNLVKSVACSGAKTGDVVGNDTHYLGQNGRLGSDGKDLSDANLVMAQSNSIGYFLPGRIHQATFVKKYLPNIVTIGIGGNDIGMVDKLKTCIGPGTCSWASDPKRREQFAVEIKNLFNTLVSTYQGIHDSSPNSKIYAVGYPLPTDSDGVCGPLTGFLLDSIERKFMNEAVVYLNQVIKAAANKVGIGFLDIQESYGQHAMCGDETPSGINSVVIGDDIGLSGESSWFKFIGNESFHPNPYGHQMAANYIFGSIGNMSEYNYCAEKVATCPNNVVAPEPSNYWIGEKYDDYPSLMLANFIFDGLDSTNLLQKKAVLPSLSLLPNSQVEIEINSIPVSLGHFSANNDGSLSIDFDLPKDLEDGFHTIHAYGKSYSGEQIDLYQVIEYQKVLPDIIEKKDGQINFDNVSDNLANNQVVNRPKPSSNNGSKALRVNQLLAQNENDYKIQTNFSADPDVLGLSVKNDSLKEDKLTTKDEKDGSASLILPIISGLAILAPIGLLIAYLHKKL